MQEGARNRKNALSDQSPPNWQHVYLYVFIDNLSTPHSPPTSPTPPITTQFPLSVCHRVFIAMRRYHDHGNS